MTDSWWLKFKRAQQHMIDIRQEVARYASLNAHEFVEVKHSDREQQIWYRLRITDQPDAALTLMLGDFVHNLRSALDHVLVACVPKRDRSNATGFPVLYEDVFGMDTNGQFVIKHSESRDHFYRAVKGLGREGFAAVMHEQPYLRGDDAYRSTIGLLTRLDNADKHKQLTVLVTGLKHVTSDVTVEGETGTISHLMSDLQFLGDNAVISWATGRFKASEVHMEHRGVPVIVVEAPGIPGRRNTPALFPLRWILRAGLMESRRILRRMEPFVVGK